MKTRFALLLAVLLLATTAIAQTGTNITADTVKARKVTVTGTPSANTDADTVGARNSALTNKANDADVMHKTGDEKVSGKKTFTNLQAVAYAEPVAGDIGAGVTAAVNSLPSCTDKASNTYAHCGAVVVSPGSYTQSSQVTVTSPYVSVNTPGVFINYTGTSTSACAYNFTASPVSADQAMGQHFGGDGFVLSGNSTPGICGVQFYDVEGFHFQGTISWFSATGSIGLWQRNVNFHTERAHIEAWLSYNKTGWKLTNDNGTTWPTFGYGNAFVHCTLGDTQTCMDLAGSTGHQVIWNNSTVNLVCNLNGTGTCLKATTGSWQAFFNITIDGAAYAGFGRVFDAASAFQGIGLYNSENAQTESVPDGIDKAFYFGNTGAGNFLSNLGNLMFGPGGSGAVNTILKLNAGDSGIPGLSLNRNGVEKCVIRVDNNYATDMLDVNCGGQTILWCSPSGGTCSFSYGPLDVKGVAVSGSTIIDNSKNVAAGGGSSTVYRCTTAGTLPIGALTITAANCGASTDSGLRIK